MASSRLNQLYDDHRSVLRRIDHLESRLASCVAAHRRRATNLIEETRDRKSHMRIFVSHRVEGGDAIGDEDSEKKKEANAKAAGDVVKKAPAPGPSRTGGKDFGALLHSSAHQKAESTETKKPSHQQQPKKGVRKWTLVIEGGLLVKQLDHTSAKEVRLFVRICMCVG